jgi:hypothetical protein
MAALYPFNRSVVAIQLCGPVIAAMRHARAWHRTPYGLAESGWRIENGELHLHIVVPPGVTATVTIPDSENIVEVGSGEHTWSIDWTV